MLNVEEWSMNLQFQFMDLNNDSKITEDEVSGGFIYAYKILLFHKFERDFKFFL